MVIERLVYLWDALLLFYFSWTGEDALIYEDYIKEIYEKKALSADNIKQIENIQSMLKKKFLTDDGKSRKKRIVQRLFVQQKKTLLYIGVYQSVLPHFNKYVKLFQSKESLLHELHVQIFNLTKQFFTFFLKHELVSSIKTYHDILKIDTADSENYLPVKLIFTGIDVLNISKKPKPDSTVIEFFEVLKKAYSRCAEYMKKKLPLKNSFLIKLSALNPSLRGETTTFTALLKLADFLPTVISKEEVSSLDQELRYYQIDSSLTSLQDTGSTKFWSEIIKRKEYPVLSKMIKALLTCFHGPSVESTFNLMDHFMTENRTSLNIESLDSLQTIKYYLNSVSASTCELFGSKDPLHEPMQQNFGLNLINSWSLYQQSLMEKNQAKKVLTISSTVELNSPCSSLSPQENVNILSINSNQSPQVPNNDEKGGKRKLPLDRKDSKTKQTKIASFFKK